MSLFLKLLLLFNETFAHIVVSIGDIIECNQTCKPENARNVFWVTSLGCKLLPTAVSRLKSLEVDSDAFLGNYE